MKRWRLFAAGGPEGELLTLTTEEAMEYNLADGVADSVEELLRLYQIVEVNGERKVLTVEGIAQKQMEFGDESVKVVKSLQDARQETVLVTFADRFVFFVTSPVISGLLFTLGRARGYCWKFGLLGLACRGSLA